MGADRGSETAAGAVTLLFSLARPLLPSLFPFTIRFSGSPQTVSFYLSRTTQNTYTRTQTHSHTGETRWNDLIWETRAHYQSHKGTRIPSFSPCDPPLPLPPSLLPSLSLSVHPFLHLSVPPSLLCARSLAFSLSTHACINSCMHTHIPSSIHTHIHTHKQGQGLLFFPATKEGEFDERVEHQGDEAQGLCLRLRLRLSLRLCLCVFLSVCACGHHTPKYINIYSPLKQAVVSYT
jgi:hypothetical protein